MRFCKTLTSKMFRGIIVDILIALVVILLWPVLFAFSSSRPSYLLDKAQEALHLLPHSQPQPAAPFALGFTKSCPSMNPPQAPEQSWSSHQPLPWNPSLISAVTRKHVVFPSLKKKKRGHIHTQRDTHCQIYWLEYFNLKINRRGKHWSKRRISGF